MAPSSKKGSCRFSKRTTIIAVSLFVVAVLAAFTVILVLALRSITSSVGTNAELPSGAINAKQSKPPDSASADFHYATVQTHTKICSTIGTSVLARYGGNAVDAAVAATLCVSAVSAHSCGIGGGFFMTLFAKPRNGNKYEVKTVLGREVAPLNATPDMFVNDTKSRSKNGGLAIGVPGEVAGLYRAWQLYGTVAWKDLVKPTADILEGGFAVEGALAHAISFKEAVIRSSPSLSSVFVKKDGGLLKEGDTFVDKVLAKTFRTIMAEPYSFYNGSLAADIIKDILDADGIITAKDLSGYTARVRKPVEAFLPDADLTVYAPPAPSSGYILNFMLRLADKFHFSPQSVKDNEATVLTYHRIAEIFKFAYAKRSALGDEDFVDIANIVANLTSDNYITGIKEMIKDSFTQDVAYYGPSFEFTDGGTAQISIVAPDGSAVSLTSTINHYFGSTVRGIRTGIMFNNQMDDFSTPGTSNFFGVPASQSNFIKPGKMPMSSMTPAIFVDSNKKVALVVGGTGGTKITSQVAFVAMQYLYMGRKLKDAVDSARIHHQLVPNVLLYEPHLNRGIVDGLRAKGHKLEKYAKIARIGSIANTCQTACAGSECFMRKCLTAVSDGRKGGNPDGF